MKFIPKFILPVFAASLFAACGNTKSGEPGKPQAAATIADTSSATIIKAVAVPGDSLAARQVQHMYDIYLHIQSALADDRREDAAKEAQALGALPDSSIKNNDSSTAMQFFRMHVYAVRQNAAIIAAGTDLEAQRKAFNLLSGHVFELLRFFGSDKPVYQAHCPMAFDDKGASWLSDRAVIRNPYYGSEMLECGTIVATIRK